MATDTAVAVSRLRWSAEGLEGGSRCTPQETPIALVHQATTTAVMMATPMDLEDFAIGFTLSEDIVDTVEDIRALETVHGPHGIEVRLWLNGDCAQRLAQRRRHLAGPTGCGLCGVESLEAAAKPPRRLPPDHVRFSPEDLLDAMVSLETAQPLGRSTRAAHAAALWRPGCDLLVREDVGRHNALDKLIGASRRAGASADSLLLLTSRVSVEMVQKAAVLGAPVICAVSAPTTLAVRTAEAANITLVGVARADGFEVFTHPGRIGMAFPPP